MDDKGLIFTLDAALALIPIFLVVVAVANFGDSGLISPSQQIRFVQDAHDTLEIMGTDQSGLKSNVLKNMATVLIENNNSEEGIQEAEEIAGSFLNKTLGNSKYSLTEINQLNKTIASNGNINNSNDASVGFKSCENYIFKLCIWN
jgi:hypothetical protein